MSAQASSWGWSLDIKPGPKFTLMALCNRADECGVTYRGQKHLAKLTGYGVSTVAGHLDWLEEQHLIKRAHRVRANGSKTTDLYLLAPRGRRGDMLAPGTDHEFWVLLESMMPDDSGPSDPAAGESGAGKSEGPDPQLLGDQDKPLDEQVSSQGGRTREQQLAEQPEAVQKVATVLDAVAAAKPCQKAGVESIAAAVERYPELDAADIARDLEFWALHGNGKRRTIKSLAGTFGNFLRRAEGDRTGSGTPGVSVQSGVQTPDDGQGTGESLDRFVDWGDEDDDPQRDS